MDFNLDVMLKRNEEAWYEEVRDEYKLGLGSKMTDQKKLIVTWRLFLQA